MLKKLSLGAAALTAGGGVVAGEAEAAGELAPVTAAKTAPGTYVSVEARLTPAECESVGTGLGVEPWPATAPEARPGPDAIGGFPGRIETGPTTLSESRAAGTVMLQLP